VKAGHHGVVGGGDLALVGVALDAEELVIRLLPELVELLLDPGADRLPAAQ